MKAIKEESVTFKILYELVLQKEEEIEQLLTHPEELEAEAKILINKNTKLYGKKSAKARYGQLFIFLLPKFCWQWYWNFRTNFILSNILIMYP